MSRSIFVYTLSLLLAFSAMGTPSRNCRNAVEGSKGVQRSTIANFQLSDQLNSVLLSGSNIVFGLNLLKQQLNTSRGDNVLVSPINVLIALSMARAGIMGVSAREMDGALAFGEATFEEILHGCRLVQQSLIAANSKESEVRLANNVWVGRQYEINPEYAKILAAGFNAEAERVTFGTPAALSKINATVSTATKRKIPKLLRQTQLDDALYLTAALYLKANWRRMFDIKKTVKVDFRGEDGTIRDNKPKVMMMHRNEPELVVFERDYQAVRLPLEGGRFVIDMILPADTLSGFVQKLDLAKFNDISSRLADAKLSGEPTPIAVPRLELDFNADLVPSLKALGMERVFTSAAGPDLAGMITGIDDLHISVVQHATKLLLAETGVEFGAGTAVGVSREAVVSGIRLDRPFLLVLRDLEGTVIGLGAVTDP